MTREGRRSTDCLLHCFLRLPKFKSFKIKYNSSVQVQIVPLYTENHSLSFLTISVLLNEQYHCEQNYKYPKMLLCLITVPWILTNQLFQVSRTAPWGTKETKGQQEGGSKYQLTPSSKGHKVAKSSREGLSAMGRQGRFVILTK